MTNEKKPSFATKLLNRRNKVYDSLLEFCKAHKDEELYAYTQTFNPTGFDRAPISKQVHSKMVDIFIPLCSCTDFIFLPEIHMNGKKFGSIHFHGILKIKSSWKFFNKTLPFLQQLGFVTIKPIFELTKWIDYLIKDHSDFIGSPFEDYLHTNAENKIIPCKRFKFCINDLIEKNTLEII